MTQLLQVYRFDGSVDAPLSEVGGKAFSLLKGSRSGLPVPPGFVLSVEFFASWFEQIKSTPEWAGFLQAQPEDLKKACDDLKATAEDLSLSASQQQDLAATMQTMGAIDLFAVRSSSPEEDLEGTSFAGGYETILGVTAATMEAAVKSAFASCLDFRVITYKREHGFDITAPKIAVVVQEQIASEIAGVGFSLNPLTNSYDEAVFNANWGQGETVVSGIATPDTFIVDRISAQIKQKVLGKKERSIWLKQTGGTEEKLNYRSDEFSLNDSQISQLNNLIDRVEKLYQKPIDIEWAFAKDELYLLQARPITSYVPLPPDMVTAPGAAKRLYLDVTISVQGIHKPLSAMGTSVLKRFIKHVSEDVLGMPKEFANIETAPAWVEWGRLYLHLNILFGIFGRGKIGNVLTNMDPLAASAILQLEGDPYKAVKEKHAHLPLHLIWHLPEHALHIIEARMLPEHAHRHAQQKIQKFMTEIRELYDKDISTPELADELLTRTLRVVLKRSMPLFVASRLALERMKTIVGTENEQDLKKLDRALPNNVTTEMGLALYRLSQLPQGSQDFDIAWKNFLALYGHRGPVELDIASPRYNQRPQLLLEQIEMLRQSATPEDNPQKRFETAQVERQKAFEELCEKIHSKGWMQLNAFQSLYRVWETLSGYREMHKYLLIFAIAKLRQRLLEDANTLVSSGRLESREQIFDLTLDDLRQSAPDKGFDLIQAARTNREPLDRLSIVPKLPAVIDSRGLILRPKAEPAREGEVSGTAISPGVARGRIKVLHTPDEKPLLRGEILVATATDPGWTPLFVNAAAVILEVGGMLQHGALVAREYGLPCVSGVDNATTRWADGTLVEVDGSSGIIRTIDSQ